MANGNGNGNDGSRTWSWWRDNYQVIGATVTIFWLSLLGIWPIVKVRADIASHKAVVELQARMVSSERNQAITTVMIAELTGRVGHGEAQALIIEIAQGKVDQGALMRLLLTTPKEDHE